MRARIAPGVVEHMVKWDGANLYVFVAARSGGSATLSMPCIGRDCDRARRKPDGGGLERLLDGFVRGRERRPHLPHRRRVALRPELGSSPIVAARDGVRRFRLQSNASAASVQPLRGLGQAANREARAGRAAVAVLGTVVSVFALVGVGGAFAVPSSSGRDEALRSGMLSRDNSTSGARNGAPRLQQIDGGLGYYGKFSNPLPTSASYFPIGVWGAYDHTAPNRNRDATVGINTYVWAADPNFVPEIRADRRFRIIQDESNRANHGSETAGWLLGDEIDMTEGPGACPRRSQLDQSRTAERSSAEVRELRQGRVELGGQRIQRPQQHFIGLLR